MRVAVLGCGSIGLRHAANLARLGGDVVAYDPSAAARRNASTQGTAIVEDLDTLWGLRPEAAVVATPTNLHYEHAKRALEAGCHVFVEKPISHSLDGLEELVQLGEGRTTMVGCNMRFHPGPRVLKRLLDAGAIGRPLAARLKTGSYLPGWRPGQDHTRSYSASPAWGGALLDCIHEIDLALWFLGPARLRAAVTIPGASIGVAAEGLAEILLSHGQAISSVHLNFIQRDYRRMCEVVGTEGTLAWDFLDGVVVQYGSDGAVQSSERQAPAWTLNDMYVDEMRHFLDACKASRPSCNPLEGGVAALRIALAARQAGP